MFYEPIITDEAQLILPVYDEDTEKMCFFMPDFQMETGKSRRNECCTK